MIVNDELGNTWKEAVVAYLNYYPSIFLESKTTKHRSHDSR